MNILQDLSPQHSHIFPVPRTVLLQTISEYTGLTEDELRLINDTNQYASDAHDPAMWLLKFNARPELKDEPLDKQVAYQTGVDFGATVVRKTIIRNGRDYIANEFLLRSEPNPWPKASRYVLSQFFEAGEDVRLLIQGTVEQHWLTEHVSFVSEDALHDRIDDPFIYGCGDALALYAFVHHEISGNKHTATLPLQLPPS